MQMCDVGENFWSSGVVGKGTPHVTYDGVYSRQVRWLAVSCNHVKCSGMKPGAIQYAARFEATVLADVE